MERLDSVKSLFRSPRMQSSWSQELSLGGGLKMACCSIVTLMGTTPYMITFEVFRYAGLFKPV